MTINCPHMRYKMKTPEKNKAEFEQFIGKDPAETIYPTFEAFTSKVEKLIAQFLRLDGCRKRPIVSLVCRPEDDTFAYHLRCDFKDGSTHKVLDHFNAFHKRNLSVDFPDDPDHLHNVINDLALDIKSWIDKFGKLR
jgi:hypothetical protein